MDGPDFKDVDIISLIETALGQTAVTSVSSKDNPNVRPPKGSYQRFYVSGYDAWLLNRIESKGYDKKYPDFPLPESEKIVKQYIDCLKAEPYKAVDFNQEKSMDEQGSEYEIKYLSLIHISEPTKRYDISYAV